MTSLFEPTRAGDLQLANRIAMAPLTRNRSPEAIPTDLVATYYAQRASASPPRLRSSNPAQIRDDNTTARPSRA